MQDKLAKGGEEKRLKKGPMEERWNEALRKQSKRVSSRERD